MALAGISEACVTETGTYWKEVPAPKNFIFLDR